MPTVPRYYWEIRNSYGFSACEAPNQLVYVGVDSSSSHRCRLAIISHLVDHTLPSSIGHPRPHVCLELYNQHITVAGLLELDRLNTHGNCNLCVQTRLITRSRNPWMLSNVLWQESWRLLRFQLSANCKTTIHVNYFFIPHYTSFITFRL